MKNFLFENLPDDYRAYRKLCLAEDRKILKYLLVGQLLLVILMIGLGWMRCSMGAAFDMELGRILLGFSAMAVGLFVYVLAHEWTHGAVIRFFGGQVHFGFRKGMAYAGSTAYFSKAAYIIIALAPLILWGILLTLLLGDVNDYFFWYLYTIQIFNVSGAVGDLYVVGVTLRMPPHTLVIDQGTTMEFFVKV